MRSFPPGSITGSSRETACAPAPTEGSGYPEDLAGDQIPLAGRVVAVVDVYDALVSARAYRRPYTHTQAVEIIAQGRGTHFDPVVVDAFLAVAEQWRQVGVELAEGPEEAARFREAGEAQGPPD